MRAPLVVLFGPTASGKTKIVSELFSARGPFPGEVVSADSMQVYKGMNIGTAKPSDEERRLVPHHLIDVCFPNEQFTAGDFVRLADSAVKDITARSLLPVLSGGTGFYLKNFIQGLPEAPPSDAGLRTALKMELQKRGAQALADELAQGDPESAERIHIHDEYRLLRAVEVLRLTGRPLSSFSWKQVNRPEYQFLIIGLRTEREALYRRINERCARMFASGLPSEVKGLFKQGYSPRDPGIRAIGYREFFAEDESGDYRFLEDEAGVQALVAQNSRRYAKRQVCFFSSLPDAAWVDADDKPVEGIKRLIEAWLGRFR
ncbi:tRNA dimethylallyltransferase 1 [Spirochaetia bacterium]|nr:tRNA dimethylallyltransferase 1 [Spirochaetia bacterium]